MLKVDLPKNKSSIIKVLGVGGGGSNAVNHMYEQGIKDVDFIVCNTDIQALEISPVPVKIQIGENGLGAGSKPEKGREAALSHLDEIREILEKNTEMLFITAGMGGGTGTGAAPVIASLAKEMNILTVAIVTVPFAFEGRRRKMQAQAGLDELRKNVDALLIISNDKLREIYGNLKITEAFHKADDVLTTAAKGIAEIITVSAHVNVDLQDVKTVMTDSGTAILGSAEAEGENRAIIAVEEALSSPLLNDNHIKGAESILLYLSYGEDELSMDEVSDITDYIQDETGNTAEVIWGMGEDLSLGNKIKVTIVATGFNKTPKQKTETAETEKKKVLTLDDSQEATPTEVLQSPQETVSGITLKKKGEPVAQQIPPEFNDDFDVPAVNEDEVDTSQIDSLVLIRKKEVKDESAKKQKDFGEERANGITKRLNELSYNISPSTISEMEQVPAYLRKEVELKDVADMEDKNKLSHKYLDASGEGEVKTRNSYLHDNVD